MKKYYHFVMIGDEGLEGYKVTENRSEITPGFLAKAEFRARMNSRRHIQGWTFTFSSIVCTTKINKNILKYLKAIKVF